MNFTKYFVITFLFLLVSLVGLIVSIDPYDKLGVNVFNFETKAVAQSRENKYLMFENSKRGYQAIILGSSAAHRYKTQTLKELTALDAYNYAVQHTTADDYIAIVKHIISKKEAKLILLNLDFTVLDKNFETDNRLFNSSLAKYLQSEKHMVQASLFDNNYFTLEAIRDSLRVVMVNQFGKARHIYEEHGNYKPETPKRGSIKVRQSSYPNYVISKKRITQLKKIKALCSQNNIELIVSISPLAFKHYQLIVMDPKLKQLHESFKKEVKLIFGRVYDFENESIRAYSKFPYFMDSSHPSSELFDVVLRKIFTSEKINLGEKL